MVAKMDHPPRSVWWRRSGFCPYGLGGLSRLSGVGAPVVTGTWQFCAEAPVELVKMKSFSLKPVSCGLPAVPFRTKLLYPVMGRRIQNRERFYERAVKKKVSPKPPKVLDS
jgi:hypothetical protein